MPFSRHNKDYRELNKIQKADKFIYFWLMATIIPGILLGGYAGMKIAQFLDSCQLFTPDTVENDD